MTVITLLELADFKAEKMKYIGIFDNWNTGGLKALEPILCLHC